MMLIGTTIYHEDDAADRGPAVLNGLLAPGFSSSAVPPTGSATQPTHRPSAQCCTACGHVRPGLYGRTVLHGPL